MRLLTRSGESALAVAHFAGLRDRLRQELGTEPAVETTALLERIRAGNIPKAADELDVAYPEFLTKTPNVVPAPLFVGRERELADLFSHLENALAGRGRVVFVAGEAGSGKTMLAAEFMRRATDAVPDLLVTRGRCNAYSGLGDPYLPFREVVGLLSGDIESSYSAGAIDRELATRLWEATPQTARLVTERAPSLLGAMVNGPLLCQRAAEATPGAEWIGRLRNLVAAGEARPPAPERMQPALFDECTAVLEGLAVDRPLLLILDDLQWADRGPIAQLRHLARRLEGVRLLIVGLYRPEETAVRDGEDHPLEPVLRELHTTTADSTIPFSGSSPVRSPHSSTGEDRPGRVSR